MSEGSQKKGELEPGSILGDYRIVEYLASGSMGKVYLAEQISLERRVAIKVFSRVLTPGPEARESFLQEIRLTAKLDHPNIVRAYDAGQDGEYLFLVMKFVDERDLAELLASYRRIDEDDAIFIAAEIAKALQYAWDEHGLIHRDIKPSNIKLNKAIEPHLLDFGIATTFEQKSALAERGYVVGTPEYVSPEQARGRQDLDFHSDVYSLGATLYHMVSGSRPFRAKTPEELLVQQIEGELEPPAVRNPKVSRKVSDLIVWMMAKKPESRPESWQAVIEALEAAAAVVDAEAKATSKEAEVEDVAGSKPTLAEAPKAVEPDDQAPSNLPWALASVLAVIAVVLIALILGRN